MKERIQNVLNFIHRSGYTNTEWNFEPTREDWPHDTKEYYGTKESAKVNGHIAIYVDLIHFDEALSLNPDMVLIMDDDATKGIAIWQY